MQKKNKILFFLFVAVIFGLFVSSYIFFLDREIEKRESLLNQRNLGTVEKSVADYQEEGDFLKVYKLDPAKVSVSVEFSEYPKFVSYWQGGEEEIIINGAYFLENYLPAGFLVVNGQRVGVGMFDQDKSGLIAVRDGKLEILDLQKNPIGQESKFDFALQSYPFLIKDGQAALTTDSLKYARRTAIGLDKERNIYILSVSKMEMSLFEFMTEILKTKIPFDYVLNLDGGPSTGLYASWNNDKFLTDSLTGVSSIIRFKKK